MSRKSKFDLLTEQAQRLFAQRMYFAAHMIIFMAGLFVTEGRLIRFGMLYAGWVVVVLLHAVYFALYENKEALLRRTYLAMEDEPDKLKHDELDAPQNYYTIGADGELVRLDDESEENG